MGKKEGMNTTMKEKSITSNKTTSQHTCESTQSEGTSLLERSEYNLDLVNNWISNADTKVSISSGVFSVIVAAIVFIAENVLKSIDKSSGLNPSLYSWFIVAVITSAVAFLASEFFHLLAISPNLKGGKKRKQEKKEPQFSIFYEHIRLFNKEEDYISSARKASEVFYENEVLKEIFYNSKICSSKMKCFRIAIWTGWSSIVLIVISCALYYCSYTIH